MEKVGVAFMSSIKSQSFVVLNVVHLSNRVLSWLKTMSESPMKDQSANLSHLVR